MGTQVRTSHFCLSSSYKSIFSLLDNDEGSLKYLEVTKAIRIHGNFFEQTLPNMLLIGVLENQGGNLRLVHLLSLALLVSRVLHSVGMNAKNTMGPSRPIGTAMSFAVGLVASLANIYVGSKAFFA